MDVYGRLRTTPKMESGKYWGKKLSQRRFSKTNFTQIDLRTNPRLRGERTGSNRLWHSTYTNTDDSKTNLLCGT